MPFCLDGKSIIVTGGGSGIGRATCQRLVADGAQVIVADINAEAAEKTAASLDNDGAVAVAMDVTDPEAWKKTTQTAIDNFGKLDSLANVAGIGSGGSIEDIELDAWQQMLDVNLTGTMLGCQAGIRAINASGGSGALVNISSIGGLVGVADIAGYCASKGGVTTLSKSIALHCAAKGYKIRCVSVHPTYVNSEMLDPVAEAGGVSREEIVAGMASLVPMGRVAEPEDIAATIAFLCSDDSSLISGTTISIDGAQLAGPPAAHFD